MNRLAAHIVRFILIAAGLFAAIVTASLFILLLARGGMTAGDPANEQLLNIAFAVSLPVVVSFAGYYSFLPAVAFGVLAEVFARRSWLFHALGGMAVALIALAIRSQSVMKSGDVVIVLAAGAVAGTAYWLIAGRSAGRHLDEWSTSASEES